MSHPIQYLQIQNIPRFLPYYTYVKNNLIYLCTIRNTSGICLFFETYPPWIRSKSIWQRERERAVRGFPKKNPDKKETKGRREGKGRGYREWEREERKEETRNHRPWGIDQSSLYQAPKINSWHVFIRVF